MSEENKKWYNLIHAPLLTAVVTSSLIVTFISAYQKDGIYSYYNYDYKTPLLSLAMRGIADGATPFYVTDDFIEMTQTHDAEYYLDVTRGSIKDGGSDSAGLSNDNANGGSGGNNKLVPGSGSSSEDDKKNSADKGSSKENAANNTVAGGSSEAASNTASNTAFNAASNKASDAGTEGQSQDDSSEGALSSATGKADASTKDASGTMDSSEEAPVEKFPYMTTTGTVDADYFADALFIGDSRTVGLSEYCEELDAQATFYGKVSLSIYEANNKAFVKSGGSKLTLDQALAGKDFKKVYIMVGINEIGYGSTDGWLNNYIEVIGKIQAACPDAIIYLQAIMHVTAEYDNTKAPNDSINGVINTRSEALKTLADNRRIFYLDINEAFDDEYGNLQADISFDGVHLKAAAYTMWYEYLKTHAAVVAQ